MPPFTLESTTGSSGIVLFSHSSATVGLPLMPNCTCGERRTCRRMGMSETHHEARDHAEEPIRIIVAEWGLQKRPQVINSCHRGQKERRNVISSPYR